MPVHNYIGQKIFFKNIWDIDEELINYLNESIRITRHLISETIDGKQRRSMVIKDVFSTKLQVFETLDGSKGQRPAVRVDNYPRKSLMRLFTFFGSSIRQK